jgi:hypothetical protein
MMEGCIRRLAYVRNIERELDLQRTRARLLEKDLDMERLVSANKQKILDILTDHRDVLLANIRDLRIEASGLKRDKETLAWEISKLLDRNRRQAEGGRR